MNPANLTAYLAQVSEAERHLTLRQPAETIAGADWNYGVRKCLNRLQFHPGAVRSRWLPPRR